MAGRNSARPFPFQQMPLGPLRKGSAQVTPVSDREARATISGPP